MKREEAEKVKNTFYDNHNNLAYFDFRHKVFEVIDSMVTEEEWIPQAYMVGDIVLHDTEVAEIIELHDIGLGFQIVITNERIKRECPNGRFNTDERHLKLIRRKGEQPVQPKPKILDQIKCSRDYPPGSLLINIVEDIKLIAKHIDSIEEE